MVEMGTSLMKSHVNTVQKGCPGGFGTPAHIEAVASSPELNDTARGRFVFCAGPNICSQTACDGCKLSFLLPLLEQAQQAAALIGPEARFSRGRRGAWTQDRPANGAHARKLAAGGHRARQARRHRTQVNVRVGYVN